MALDHAAGSSQIPPDGLARLATVVGTPTPSAITRQQILARLADRAMQEVYAPGA